MVSGPPRTDGSGRMSEVQVEIHRVTAANVGDLADVHSDIFDSEIDPARLAAFVDDPHHLLVIARTGTLVVGQIRGIIHLQPDGGSQLYIDNLGVAPELRRRGLARALLREVLAWGRAHGCVDAWVATEPDNRPARRLYEQLARQPGETMACYILDIGALD